MKVIMLAAGVGQRLFGKDNNELPKSLLRFDGKTLLQRHIEVLKDNGIDELIMVVGYRKEALAVEVATVGATDYVRTIFNPDFRGGPMISLWTARDALSSGEPMMFMDADVLYHPVMIERLVKSRHANCFVMDRNTDIPDDPVRVCIDNDVVVDFGKGVEGDFDLIGHWPGFMTMAPDVAAKIADMTQVYMDTGRDALTYECAMRDVVTSEPHGTFGYEDISGVPWIEIDWPHDLRYANESVQPRIAEMGDT
jgi:choline kinase